MLLLAAFASAPEPELSDGLRELQARLRPERVLLFGAAARQVAEDLRAERADADERFLDEAARYLLENGSAVPVRAHEDALLRVCLAVVAEAREDLAPLEATERAMEIAGRLIVMALPDEEALAAEDLDNAGAWLVGGATRSLSERAGRPVLSPGDFSRDGTLLAVEVAASRLVARALHRDGREVEARVFSLKEKSRMSVLG